MDLFLEAHERETHPLDFVVRQRASLHAANRLSLEKLPHEFHECEHELREPLLDIVGVDIHPLGEDATKPFDFAAELVELGIHAHRIGRASCRKRWWGTEKAGSG